MRLRILVSIMVQAALTAGGLALVGMGVEAWLGHTRRLELAQSDLSDLRYRVRELEQERGDLSPDETLRNYGQAKPPDADEPF